MPRLCTATDFDPLTAVHYQETDPGVVWIKDAAPAIDVNPAAATGGALTPNVVRLPDGGYRLYYLGFAPDVTRDDHSGHIVSAWSSDGEVWTSDPGVRVEVHPPHAIQLRTLCPDVVPMPEGGYRMYFEARVPAARIGEHDFRTAILSATSEDGLGVDAGRGRPAVGPRMDVRHPALRLLPDGAGAPLPTLLPPVPVPAEPPALSADDHRQRRLLRRAELRARGRRAHTAGDTAGVDGVLRARRSSVSATAPSGCTTPPGRRASTAASSPRSRTTASSGRSRLSRCSTWTRPWTLR